jgi:YD repeat-containing protein
VTPKGVFSLRCEMRFAKRTLAAAGVFFLLCAPGCTRPPPEPEQEYPPDAVAIVQTGRCIQNDKRGLRDRQPFSEYVYSEARYNRAGQLMERVTYRRDGTRYVVREYEDGRIQSETQFDEDGRTVESVEWFMYDDANRLVEMRYCPIAVLDCEPWRVDVVETWTPEGLPLLGSVPVSLDLDKGVPARIDWKYDVERRLIEKKLAYSTWSFTYDARGRLIEWQPSYINGDEGPRVFEYDDAGRMVREAERGWGSADAVVIDYSYEQLLELQPGVTITGVEAITQSYGSMIMFDVRL